MKEELMFLLKIYFRFHVFLSSFFANFFANNKQNKSNGLDSAKPGQAPHIKFPKKDSLLLNQHSPIMKQD